MEEVEIAAAHPENPKEEGEASEEAHAAPALAEAQKDTAVEGPGTTLSVPELTPLPASPAASDVDDDASSSGDEPPASEAAAPDTTADVEEKETVDGEEEEKATTSTTEVSSS